MATEATCGSTPLILVHQYFWPDSSPYGNLLRGIGEHLAAEGHSVTVLTTQPNYGTAQASRPACEKIGALTVRRTWGGPTRKNFFVRALTSAWFCGFIARRLIFGPRNAVVMCSTMPPVIGAAVARWATALRGGRFVYHLMDIHPEAAEFAAVVKRGPLTNILRKIDQRTVRRADAVVALSHDMLDTLRSRQLADDSHLSVITNYTLPSFDDDDGAGGESALPPEFDKAAGCFRVIFAGNIGHFQQLDTVIEAARILRDRTGIEFVFVGEGKALEQLQDDAGEMLGNSVKFFPRQSVAVAEKLAADSDLCLVTLAKDIYRVAFPSKTATYLARQRPLLVVAEPESELSKLCSERGAGIACAPGDAESLAKLISAAAAEPDSIAQMAEAAGLLGREQFSREVIFPQWTALIDSLKADEQKTPSDPAA